MQLWVQTMLPQHRETTRCCKWCARLAKINENARYTRTSYISFVKEQEINSFWRSPGFGNSQFAIHMEHRGDCRKQTHRTNTATWSYTQNIFKWWKFNLTFPNQTKEEKSFALCVDACTLQLLYTTHPLPFLLPQKYPAIAAYCVTHFVTFCCVSIFISLRFSFVCEWFCKCLCDATIVLFNESFECI